MGTRVWTAVGVLVVVGLGATTAVIAFTTLAAIEAMNRLGLA